MVAKVLIEDCTEVHLYVGKAINSAYQNPGLPFDLGIRQNLVEQLRKKGLGIIYISHKMDEIFPDL